MAFAVPVYRAEVEAGVDALVQANRSVAVFARPEVVVPDARAVASLAASSGAPEWARASTGDFDLLVLRSVLASTGWNLNDDVFDPKETFAARRTPIDKPFNYEHDQRNILGHAVASVVVARDGTEVADDAVADDVPDDFDLVTSDVVYLQWADAERKAWVEKLVAEIKDGKWMVSMEALLRDFDYAVIGPDGAHSVVARDRKTAHMTASLRAYGGTGELNGAKVGRLMRSFVFSGKGLVADPGNPRSGFVSAPRASTAASVVYPNSSGLAPPTQQETEMAEKTDEADALRADLHAAEAAKKGLDADLAKAVQRAEKAEADLGGVVAKMEKAQADLGVARDELAKTKADLAVAVKARGDAEASLEAAVADARLQKRTAAVAAAMRLGPDDEAVKSLVDDLDEVSDAKFASALARLAPRPSAASIENADPKNLEAAVASASVGASPSPSGPDDDVELEQAIASYLDDSMGDNK